MDNKRVRRRFNRLLDIAPEFKQIMLSSDSIDIKKEKIGEFLSELLVTTFNDNPVIPPLEWILARDAIVVFRTFLSARNESLAGFNLIQYLDDLVNKENIKGIEKPSQGFFAEIEHLLKCIMKKTDVYSEKTPAFIKYEGQKAAKLRSADLSRIAIRTNEFISRYPSGLDDDVMRDRSINKSRILDYFGATELEWEKWRWHTKNSIRDVKTLASLIRLTDEEYQAVELAGKYKIPFGITPYYLSLIDFEPGRERDYAVRAQVIPSLHYVNKMIELRNSRQPSMDFMLEQDTSPIEGVTRRYPNIVILKPILTCPQICVYCQRNWEIRNLHSTKALMAQDKLEKAIQWIENTPEINEVLITGGDPLLMSNAKIENLLFKLSRIKHIVRIRIGTRTPVTLPQRITDSLIRAIRYFHNPGRREIVIITHFEHPYEISPQAMTAVQKFRRCGIDVYNQLVYTFYNSRKFEAAALRQQLRLIGVTPYYTFNTKGKEETDEYRVPITRLIQEQQEEARLLPGTVRTDEIVFNVPRLGKNYLRASGHHDVISILPDGRRVYEFHPWEKKLALSETYIYTDVSIYDYMERLKAVGEKISDYKTIWYYY